MIKFIHLLFLVFINGIFSNPANAQVNLVPNYSFEVYDTCPYFDSQITYAIPWFQPYIPQSSTDYLNSCSPDSIVNVPKNNLGYQFARTGNAYAGFSTGYFNPQNNYREYLEVELNDSLKSNKFYCISFYISFANNSNRSCDGIGAYLSQNIVTYTGPPWGALNYTPQIQNPAGNILSDTANWILISDTMIAQGGEKFITIGNFKNDNNTNYIQNSFGIFYASYYYIDDVSVILCDSTTGLNDLSNHQTNLSITPNPASGNCTIHLTPGPSPRERGAGPLQLRLYDLTGRVLLRQPFIAPAQLNLAGVQAGMYVVEVGDGERSVKSRLLKIDD